LPDGHLAFAVQLAPGSVEAARYPYEAVVIRTKSSGEGVEGVAGATAEAAGGFDRVVSAWGDVGFGNGTGDASGESATVRAGAGSGAVDPPVGGKGGVRVTGAGDAADARGLVAEC
jgi:hypothetical protein